MPLQWRTPRPPCRGAARERAGDAIRATARQQSSAMNRDIDRGAHSERGYATAGSQRPTLAVIIPAYNEEHAVRGTVEEVRRALEGTPVSHEIIVVNDGSTDNTMAEAHAGGARVIDFADNA